MSANSADGNRHPQPESPTDAADRIEVVLVKSGRTKIRYPARLLHDDGTRITVQAPWAGGVVRDFGFVRFEPGDVFTEHYWRDRWYSVKEVRAADGTLKGWYCDVTRPAVLSGGELVVEDLDLDLWVSGDGTAVLRLDEDEFAASGLAESDPAAASAARRALDDLERLAHGAGPGGRASLAGVVSP
ncbi:DUF402 domain-containing protein [Streptomyces himalayensis]|uniref:DUF402 domain-containing protein n=1 Tax=Streptomyces himalayensis subsp. himalayensis TaxID=2756131 RepID=A0A7W0DRR4_9ACTN|nr:DUF402 domain-containing protein [Streptomyces himalayensis]MBA2949981.1 DUF402 domain-containing protein [Streptomyces himalayensis subsp. himalayensis]